MAAPSPPLPPVLGFVYDEAVSIPEYLRAAAADPTAGDVPAALLSSILVARRRRPVAGTPAERAPAVRLSDLGRRQGAHLQLGVLLRVIHRNLQAQLRCALSRGHRLGNGGGQRAAADADTDLLCLPGSTHRDQFLSKDWVTLLRLVGAPGMAALLGSLTHAVFRRLPNGCFQQLAGIMMDDDLRELLRGMKQAGLSPSPQLPLHLPAASVATTTATPSPRGAGGTVPTPPLVAGGKWVWPRTDVRAAVGSRWGPAAPLPSTRSLLNYAASTHRPGLPADHPLVGLSRHVRERRVKLGLPMQQQPHSGAAVQAFVAPPAALTASNNAARNLVHAVRVRAVHRADLAAHNGRVLAAGADASWGRHAGGSTAASASVAGVAVSSVSTRVGASATLQPAAVSLLPSLPPVSAAAAPRRAATSSGMHADGGGRPLLRAGSAASSTASLTASLAAVGAGAAGAKAEDAIPSHLTPLVPCFRELVTRHAACRYGELLSRHCPRRDFMPRRPRVVAAAATTAAAAAAAVDGGGATLAAPVITPAPTASTTERALPSGACVPSAAASSSLAGKKRPIEQLVPVPPNARPVAVGDASTPSGPSSSFVSAPSLSVPGRAASSSTRSDGHGHPDSSARGAAAGLADLLRAPESLATTHDHVMGFVRAVLAALLPPPLWGNAASRRSILRAAWVWVTAGARDTLRVDALMGGLPTTAFDVFCGGRQRQQSRPHPYPQPQNTLLGVHAGSEQPRKRAKRGVDAAADNCARSAASTAAAPRCTRASGTGHADTSAVSNPTSRGVAGGSSPTPSDRARQAALTHVWVAWLLLGLVHPLLRNNFYVTESEGAYHRPLYYRKPTWARMTQAALEKLRITLQLAPVVPAPPLRALAATSLGVAPMRLMPKSTGLRPIMNLSVDPSALKLRPQVPSAAVVVGGGAAARAGNSGAALSGPARPTRTPSTTSAATAPSSASLAGGSAPAKSINKTLEVLHRVLRCARAAAPGMVGAAVFGMDGMHKAMRRFADARGCGEHAAVRLGGAVEGFPAQAAATASPVPLAAESAASAPLPTPPPLYILTCDVKSAYDSLLQGLTVDTAAALVSPGEFEVRQYISVRAPEGLGSGSGGGTASSARAANPSVNQSGPNNTCGSGSSAEGGGSSSGGGLPSVGVSAGSLGPGRAIQYHKVAIPLAQRQPFSAHAASSLAPCARDAVFIDLGQSERVSRATVVSLLQQHVCAHSVVLPGGGEIARQGRGIPQGSVLSSMLCNLYLARMEREAVVPRMREAIAKAEAKAEAKAAAGLPTSDASMAGVEGVAHIGAHYASPSSSPSLMMRHTDDFIMLTPSLRVADAFARVMHASFPAYNVFISSTKSQTSLDLEDVVCVEAAATSPLASAASSSSSNPPATTTTSVPVMLRAAPLLSDGSPAPVPWCGILLDPSTGCVTSDYERYTGPGKIRAALTVSLAPSPAASLVRSLFSYLRPKCHALFLDGCVNPTPVVALNVFQLCLVGAAKFAVLLRVLKAEHGVEFRPEIVAAVVREGEEYLIALVRRQCPGQRPPPFRSQHHRGGGGCGHASPALSVGTVTVGGGSPLLTVADPDPVAAVAVAVAAAAVTSIGHTLLVGVTGTEWLGAATAATAAASAAVLPAASPASLEAASEVGPSGSIAAPPAATPHRKPYCPLRNDELRWLYLTAFSRALTRIVATEVAHILLQHRRRLTQSQSKSSAGGGGMPEREAVPIRCEVLHASAPHRSAFFAALDLHGR